MLSELTQAVRDVLRQQMWRVDGSVGGAGWRALAKHCGCRGQEVALVLAAQRWCSASGPLREAPHAAAVESMDSNSFAVVQRYYWEEPGAEAETQYPRSAPRSNTHCWIELLFRKATEFLHYVLNKQTHL